MSPRAKKRASREVPSWGSYKWFCLGAILLLTFGAILLIQLRQGTASRPAGPGGGLPSGSFLEPEQKVFAEYAGSASCRNCHEEAFQLWERSHHRLAERPPDPALDQIAFHPPVSFQHGSQQTGLRADGTNYLASCLGLSGTNETHRVARVIGHDPLRQFLVAAPGGRLQTLEASYDPHSNQWFNVYRDEDRQPGEWGHWTGRGMNWNTMCAGCHNTRVRKNYDEAADLFKTTMAEPTVSCEACHGPLKAHVDWQNQYGRSGKKDSTIIRLGRTQTMDNCAFCHARRTDLTGDFKPGDSFFDHQSLAIVDESELFYPDGQVREEDYEWAPFLSSRMHSKGVACADCHHPHSTKTLLPGNLLCLRCHDGSNTNAPFINPVAHSGHKVFGFDAAGKWQGFDLSRYRPKEIKETGGECVNCHMPQTVYMQRHRRHDHSFTIPDPLLTKQHGIPNACNRCHQDKSVDWALETTGKWYGQKMERPSRLRTQWIAGARDGDPAARQPLITLLTGDENPYWQAVAAGLLGQWAGEADVSEALLKVLENPSPLVRERAVRSIEPLAATNPKVGEALRKLLADPSRNVRISAAWALRADSPPDTLAVQELQHSLAINADQPTGQMQQGAYALAHGQSQEAVAHYEKAVAWDPNSAPIRHDLAVALSLQGRTREAVGQLEAAVRLEPGEAEYAFKLGLAWNELGEMEKTVAAFDKAVQVDPRHDRAWYNLGLARNVLGQKEPALEALSRAESIAPNDVRAPYARATILAQAGRLQEARAALKRCLEIDPQNADAQRLLEQITGPSR